MTTKKRPWGKMPTRSTHDIVNERCTCGHLRSEHGQRFGQGHGQCFFPCCTCHQFTWKEFIVAPRGKARP